MPELDYIYRGQAENFAYFRIPKALFVSDFSDMSSDAKLLYGIFLDRVELSRKNNWFDENERCYIIFPVDEITATLNCATEKVSKCLSELETVGLIERKRQGLGKPNIIFVKDFTSSASVNRNSRISKIEIQEFRKSKGIKTDINKPDINKKETVSDETVKKAGTGGQYSAEFERFWDAYPKCKRKKYKQDAWKAFQKVIQQTSIEDIVAALDWQSKSRDWTKQGGEYIPLPATWLNKGGWADEQPETAKGKNYDDRKGWSIL